MRQIRLSANRRTQAGSSLFEVMIAVLVLSTGMLGVAAMQSASLRNSQSALQRSNAIMYTYAIVDAMRANADSARANAYNLALPSTGCSVPAAGSTLASQDLNYWLTSMRGNQAMGTSACGGVACVAGVCEIAVRWNDEAGSGGSAAQTLRTRSRL